MDMFFIDLFGREEIEQIKRHLGTSEFKRITVEVLFFLMPIMLKYELPKEYSKFKGDISKKKACYKATYNSNSKRRRRMFFESPALKFLLPVFDNAQMVSFFNNQAPDDKKWLLKTYKELNLEWLFIAM